MHDDCTHVQYNQWYCTGVQHPSRHGVVFVLYLCQRYSNNYTVWHNTVIAALFYVGILSSCAVVPFPKSAITTGTLLLLL